MKFWKRDELWIGYWEMMAVINQVASFECIPKTKEGDASLPSSSVLHMVKAVIVYLLL